MSPVLTSEQRAEMQSDFDILSSDASDTQVLTNDGTVDNGDATDDSASSESADNTGTAESGDGSDPSVGDQVVDSDTDTTKDAEIIETDLDGKKVKVSRGIQKRFGKFTNDIAARDRTIAEANQREADLKRQLDEANARAIKPADTVKPVEPITTVQADTVVDKFVASDPPTMDDTNPDGTAKYATYGAFHAAHSKWANEAIKAAAEHGTKAVAKLVEQAVTKLKTDIETQRVTETAAQKAEREFTEQKTAYESRRDATKAANKDFVDLVEKNKNNVSITPDMKRIIFTDERGPEIQLWLAKNPIEAARIVALPAHRQGIEAGIIISKLGPPKTTTSQSGPGTGSGTGTGTGDKPNTPPVKRSVKLPPPPLPRGAGNGSRGSGGRLTYKKASEMSMDDYLAARADGTIS